MDDKDTTNYYFPPPDYSDLDLSFTSTTTDRTTTTTTTSARSSLARSSLTLSFNDRLSTTTNSTSTTLPKRPHSKSDPHWSAIKAAETAIKVAEVDGAGGGKGGSRLDGGPVGAVGAFVEASTLSSTGSIHLRHLKLIHHLGTGNLGRVFLCRLRDYDHNTQFALKVVDRDALSPKKLSQVQTEAQILSLLDHPFLPTLYAHIEVSHYTCLLIDYCPNGDLHSLLSKQPSNRLPLESVVFYAAEVLVALEYLHANGVVYRDLKPENVLLREDGHVMLSDFDLCFKSDVVPKLETRSHRRTAGTPRRRRRCNCFSDRRPEEETVMEFVAEPTTAFSKSCVGTHEYLAPELVSGNGHGNGVDWWAFGVLVYELLNGTTPFKGASKEATLRNIASSRGVRFQVEAEEEVVAGMAEARDLIEKLLVKDPRRRLGCARGATDIKRHPFFNGIKWPLIRMYKPPEVRGLVVKKAKSQMSHVTGGSSFQKRRRLWWWKGLNSIMRKSMGSKRNLNANQNYYCYANGSGNEVGKSG